MGQNPSLNEKSFMLTTVESAPQSSAPGIIHILPDAAKNIIREAHQINESYSLAVFVAAAISHKMSIVLDCLLKFFGSSIESVDGKKRRSKEIANGRIWRPAGS